MLANRIDVPYQSLMKVYLAERVNQELRRGLEPADLAAMIREPEAPYGVAPAGTHRRTVAEGWPNAKLPVGLRLGVRPLAVDGLAVRVESSSPGRTHRSAGSPSMLAAFLVRW